MSTTAPQPATTPIPVQLSEPEFKAFILPHLSMPKRGPKCKLGYYRVFNLILWSSTRGCSGSVCPCRQTPKARRPSTTPLSTKSLRNGPMMGHCGRHLWRVSGIWRPRNSLIPVCSMATGPTPWPKKGRWHRLFRPQAPKGRESHRHHRQQWVCLSSRPRGSRQ